jgi:hypothetical protein
MLEVEGGGGGGGRGGVAELEGSGSAEGHQQGYRKGTKLSRERSNECCSTGVITLLS